MNIYRIISKFQIVTNECLSVMRLSSLLLHYFQGKIVITTPRSLRGYRVASHAIYHENLKGKRSGAHTRRSFTKAPER